MNEEPVEEENNEKSQQVQSSGELEVEAIEEVPNGQSDPEESENDFTMSFAHRETNNDYSFVINSQKQIKDKYLTVFVTESKSLKSELRQLREITRQE